MIWLSVLNLKCQSKYSTFSKRSKIHAFVTVSKYFCTFECCEAFLKPFDFKFSQITEISEIRKHSVFFKIFVTKCQVQSHLSLLKIRNIARKRYCSTTEKKRDNETYIYYFHKIVKERRNI